MKTAFILAAIVAVAVADITFYKGGQCGGSPGETVESDTCAEVKVKWAGSPINSFNSHDAGSSWYFSANTDKNCNNVFVEANLVKDCIEISPDFEFESGNYGSMKYN